MGYIGNNPNTQLPVFSREKVFTVTPVPTTAGTYTLGAHGFNQTPKSIEVWLECLTAEQGYSVGDVVRPEEIYSSPTLWTHTPSADSTNVYVVIGNAAGIAAPHKTTGASQALTAANWKLIVRAWA